MRHSTKIRNLINFSVLLGTVFWFFSASAATITAYADRNPAYLNESFQLVFEAEGTIDGDPDFRPLEQDFEILRRSQNSNLSIVNGQISRKTIWNVNLMPRQAGSFLVPPISFGNDRSPSLNITVKPEQATPSAQADGDIFLEVEARPEEVYVQSQVVYVIRLYRKVDIRSASLTEPKLSDADAVIKKLGDDNKYETRVNGVRYAVIERRYAIFPQNSGSLTIEPVMFEGEVIRSGSSVFDPFGRNGRLSRIHSQPIELKVNGVPSESQHKQWLPSKEVRLVEEWPAETPTFKVGEPVTRTVALLADGLTAAQLPKLAGELPEGLKQYPDQPTLNDQITGEGIVGIRQEKIAIMPTRPGSYTLPGIEVSWWNTEQQRLETARIAEREIQVLPANSAARSDKASLANSATSGNSAATQDSIAEDAKEQPWSIWPWLSLMLGVGWSATGFLWWQQYRNRRASTSPSHTETSRKPPYPGNANLEAACRNNQAVQARDALLKWAGEQWPRTPITSLGKLSGMTPEPLATEIDKLEQVLYSRNPEQWEGETLWRQVEQFQHKTTTTPDINEQPLEPLFR